MEISPTTSGANGIHIDNNVEFTLKDSGTGGTINYTGKDTTKQYGAIEIGTVYRGQFANALEFEKGNDSTAPYKDSYEASNATFNMLGGQIISSNSSGIVSGDKNTINISGGSVEYDLKNGTAATTENNMAIYAAGITNLNVTGDASITSSHVAIELRGGQLIVGKDEKGNISNPTISTSATPSDGLGYHASGIGSTTDNGAAIVVTQHTHLKNITVDISGGNISGYTALAITDAQGYSTRGCW